MTLILTAGRFKKTSRCYARKVRRVFVTFMGLTCLVADECGQSGGDPDSDEDVIIDYHLAEMLPRPGPLPTISVTPHSPANKTYPVLEDTLHQLRELHETVERMIDVTGRRIKNPNIILEPLLIHTRLSASCPTLNESVPELETLGGSLGSSPLHQPHSRKGSGTQDWLCQPEAQRRRSWTALEDLSGTKEKTKHGRQRSMSLSSMESDPDESSIIDNVDGVAKRLLGASDPSAVSVSRRGTRTGGGASTHSLNEADLQNDFNKIKAKREAEQLRLPARLPLQKSVSTPSIIAVRDLVPEPALVGAQPTLPMGRPSGTESETEEEVCRSTRAHYDPHHISHLHHVAYDPQLEKRRKRGSLFFRKKKDKSKKITHQWVSASYGSTHNCDFCGKLLSNKPALYCENCLTTVHQNSCKDNILECTKPKGSKNSGKIGAFAVSQLSNSKSSLTKRGSGSFSTSSQSRRSQLCYSPWRRVATKLGVNQILCDDTDHSHHDSASCSFAEDVPFVQLEFLSDSQITASDLCPDTSLGLHEGEPDSWTSCVGKEIARKLKEKEVKRQEHIYEFILTEKHHCITLLVMQKIFVDGLQKYFHLGARLEHMFPRLADLIELHLGLLSRLRLRQREAPIVTTIADILLDEFSNIRATKLKSAYGEFCSRHRDAVESYKCYLQSDARFGQFVRHCQQNPLLKKKGIPECILFVTQRLTKYPLLIEPLIKTSKDNRKEQEALQRALALVKEILVEVDAQVAEKEKEDRKLEIYNKIDAKSYTIHRENKFKKSDILQGNRSLRFEGVAMLMQGRGKMQIVLVIVLSDVLFFLQENSNKYTFFTPDNKAGVVSLQKLLVREKAGQESRGIYLISSNPADPEMFELKVHKPKDKQVWIQAIRSAVQNCPEDEEDNAAMSQEEKQTLLNAKQTQIKHLVDSDMDIEGLLRQKDVELALLLEEKMSLQLQMLAAAGLEPPSPPGYSHLVNESANTDQMWKEVLTVVNEWNQLVATSLFANGTNLARSVSSAGEHQSSTYVSPILPKRAETFGGYDNSNPGPLKLFGRKLYTGITPTMLGPDLENLKSGDSRLFEKLPYRNCVLTAPPPPMTNGNTLTTPCEPNLVVNQEHVLDKEQQYVAGQLSHYVYTFFSVISQLMTTNDCLQAQVATMKGGGGDKHYRHDQQLEELRNLQDKLNAEKAAWAATKEQEMKDQEERKAELLKWQEQVRAEQSDVNHQREQLYRKMEILTNQGLLISPNVALPVTGQLDDSSEESSPQSDNSSAVSSGAAHSTCERKKDPKWNKSQTKYQISMNLISNINQAKAPQVSVKQLIPLKLASRSSSKNVGQAVGPQQMTAQAKRNSTGYQRLGNENFSPTSGEAASVKQMIPMKLSSRSSTGNVQQMAPSGPQQMLPLKLSEEEKVRRTSTGYQRLRSESFSPPSGETTPTSIHSRTGSSPAMMQASPPPTSSCPPILQQPPSAGSKASRTNTYPKLPDKFKVRTGDQVAPTDEEVIYF
ncbi:PREDICTED: rho guanine nucleotide exchange factor 18-like isoform X2 [Nicrophorus vespilloides]|uniref:Rho guanine nucleotide exchange factor 18-like isoform X2 n=1 Tax=Nicrophorus vespilloides TaxID=110193 RepID=A0ABM1MFY5_NICVS|nr:PREDICTED: rho guanine nucleotide exchange factor 18-like isoform X2 [Nicrophorus vespilloides]